MDREGCIRLISLDVSAFRYKLESTVRRIKELLLFTVVLYKVEYIYIDCCSQNFCVWVCFGLSPYLHIRCVCFGLVFSVILFRATSKNT